MCACLRVSEAGGARARLGWLGWAALMWVLVLCVRGGAGRGDSVCGGGEGETGCVCVCGGGGDGSARKELWNSQGTGRIRCVGVLHCRGKVAAEAGTHALLLAMDVRKLCHASQQRAGGVSVLLQDSERSGDGTLTVCLGAPALARWRSSSPSCTLLQNVRTQSKPRTGQPSYSRLLDPKTVKKLQMSTCFQIGCQSRRVLAGCETARRARRSAVRSSSSSSGALMPSWASMV